MKESLNSAGRKRVRLNPEVRSRQILDAALVEFSQHGFAAARIEDIAARAGLSKSGVYAHYSSKDEIFEALLVAVLAPQGKGGGSWLPDPDTPLPEMVQSYIDDVYAQMQDPDIVAAFRLVVAESARVPHLIQRWHAQVMDDHRIRDQAIVDECVRRGVMRRSALTEHFVLAVSPAVVWMLMYTVLKDDAPMSLEQVREAHRQLLLDVLQPR